MSWRIEDMVPQLRQSVPTFAPVQRGSEVTSIFRDRIRAEVLIVTHGHFDQVGAVADFKKTTAASLVIRRPRQGSANAT
jgi:mRNA degradation ribonuclease J1/J2